MSVENVRTYDLSYRIKEQNYIDFVDGRCPVSYRFSTYEEHISGTRTKSVGLCNDLRQVRN